MKRERVDWKSEERKRRMEECREKEENRRVKRVRVESKSEDRKSRMEE